MMGLKKILYIIVVDLIDVIPLKTLVRIPGLGYVGPEDIGGAIKGKQDRYTI